jgi:uncharacterized membrane protein YgaE (UPF0421/DUF939 family)
VALINLRGLARWGLTVEVVKTALAAAVSWEVAVLLLGSRSPYFAPLAAILAGQVTVAESVSRGGQRILGVVGGLALSMVAVHFLGLSAWSVGFLVLVGMAMATALGFGPLAISQVAVSGLLVMSLGGKPDYAVRRLLDTMLGAVVAVAVNAIVVPPDATPAARSHLAGLSREVAGLLRRLAEDVERDRGVRRHVAEARRLSTRIEEVRQAVARARESLRYSPLVQRRRHRLGRLESGLSLLERVIMQVRGVARSLAIMEAAGGKSFRRLTGPLIQAMADALAVYADTVIDPSADATARLEEAVRLASEREQDVLDTLTEAPNPICLREAGSVLADFGKMLRDLEDARAVAP